MMKPAMSPPTGVPSEGMMSLIPAFEADSESTTWKKSGIVKRNYSIVSVAWFLFLKWKLTAKADIPHNTLLTMLLITTLPLSIDIGKTGKASVFNSTQTKTIRMTTLMAKLIMTLVSDHGY
jgi:hypothetical protein